MTKTASDRRDPPLARRTASSASPGSNGHAGWFPPADILEDDEAYLFNIDLPRAIPEKIRIVVERDGLCISGHRAAPGQKGKKCLRLERPHGYFERRFALPDDASRLEICSDFQEGVLELRVAKVNLQSQNTRVSKKTVPGTLIRFAL